MQAPLLPVRHPNTDFFIADIFDSLPVKADRHTMEHPFFALSTKPDFRIMEYKRDGISVKVVPQGELGLPTMMDKDILLYVGSLLMREINAGKIPSKTVRFSCHDLMVTTNRHTNDVAYRMLANAFERITGCLITTDIKTNGVKETAGFHILEKYRVIESSHIARRMVRAEVTVSDWFYNALIGREVLTINRDYFRLRKPLERRLYELARKHCGKQETWQIGLSSLHEKCGALSPLKNFRFQLRELIETNHLPDYRIALDDRDTVIFTRHMDAAKSPLDGKAMPVAPADIPALSPKTLQRGAALVDQAGTGWDYAAIRSQFTESLANGFKPANANGAFINFVKKKIRQRP